MNIAEIIGKNIKLCLDETEMSIIEYAKIIEVTRQSASNYINGTSIIDSKNLYITAQHFNKSLEWFFDEEHVITRYTNKDIDKIFKENDRLKSILSAIKTLLGD